MCPESFYGSHRHQRSTDLVRRIDGPLGARSLTAGTGCFVAQELAHVSAGRLALAREAEAGDKKAARALKALERLSLMPAGAQLGITICTLGLGSVSKPAISHELDPLLHKLGLPSGLSYGVSFAVAMVVVRLSNAPVRLCRVTPRDELAEVHNREQLTHLVEESKRPGLISETDSELLTVGSAHARDALIARTRGRTVTARDLARPIPELTEQDTISHAIEQLRRRRAFLAVVRDEIGNLTGMVTLDDLLARSCIPRRHNGGAPVRRLNSGRRTGRWEQARTANARSRSLHSPR